MSKAVIFILSTIIAALRKLEKFKFLFNTLKQGIDQEQLSQCDKDQ